jgi:hypothetical protein
LGFRILGEEETEEAAREQEEVGADYDDPLILRNIIH